MYKLHKENPEVYMVEKLAKDYRIMRQCMHAILWLKELEEEEKKKLGHPLDDSVELLLDTCPDNSSLRCGLESAIKNLHNLHLGYVEGNTGSAVKSSPDSVTREQMLVDLAFRTKVLFWSVVVLSSLAIGILGYSSEAGAQVVAD